MKIFHFCKNISKGCIGVSMFDNWDIRYSLVSSFGQLFGQNHLKIFVSVNFFVSLVKVLLRICVNSFVVVLWLVSVFVYLQGLESDNTSYPIEVKMLLCSVFCSGIWFQNLCKKYKPFLVVKLFHYCFTVCPLKIWSFQSSQ